MSSSALLLIICYVAINGVETQNADEGVAARIFQLLLAGQIPIVIYFAYKWLPKFFKEAIRIILLQITAVLLAVALIVFLER